MLRKGHSILYSQPGQTSRLVVPPRRLARHFQASSRHLAAEPNHYDVLGVPQNASRKEIRQRFYELSRKYHPDAPSTSSTVEERTARFQSISQSWAVLSDANARRQYDSSLTGRSTYPSRPTYTTASGRESGFGGGSAAAWSTSNNDARRASANYAWSHPARKRNTSSASAAGAARADPFAKQQHDTRGVDDHFASYSTRDAKARQRYEQYGGGGVWGSGTAGFGAKAEEESRLINDSSMLRYGQVFFLFMGAFALSHLFSSRKRDDAKTARK